MAQPVKSKYRIPFDGEFKIKDLPTGPPEGAPKKRELEAQLEELVEEIGELQRKLYASDRHSVLLVFQAMDAAGKDGTIRALLTGVDPTGCQVHAFKAPSTEELDHDFLWRTAVRLPERGRIGVFNRSYYEEVLVVRVHPEYLNSQRLPNVDLDQIWDERLESIRDHERHLARNGTVVLKFFLNVSPEVQRERLLERIEDPAKNWKFDLKDVDEREHWLAYMKAYQRALAATSRPEAPWFAIPADDKAYMRVCVAEIVVDTLKSLDLAYPETSPQVAEKLHEMRARLLEK